MTASLIPGFMTETGPATDPIIITTKKTAPVV
jgi:hypothetical protein